MGGKGEILLLGVRCWVLAREMGIESFKDLEIWRKGIALAKEIYLLTRDFPKEEIYGLTNQMQRAAISIPSNIAEGFLRQYLKERIQFLFVALSSCGELDTQFFLAKELGYLREDGFVALSERINHLARMIRALINSLSRKKDDKRKPNT